MKNIGLLTLDPKIYNYGGLLQEYALQKILTGLNYKCEIINYSPNEEIYTFSIKRSLKNFKITKLKNRILYLRNRQNHLEKKVDEKIFLRKKAFDEFRNNNMIISKPIQKKELAEYSNKFTTVICGSDQIWNPSYNIPSFFLGFTSKKTRKIIYAASIGKKRLTRFEQKVYREMMSNLDFVSVREKSAQDIVTPLFNGKVDLVLDPTLLLDKEVWKKLACEVPVYYSKYVFCYFLENNNEKKAAAKKIAEDNKLKLVSLPLVSEFASINDEKLYSIGPKEFLNLILNADIVLTDSFHATVFSILFEKKFFVFGRKYEDYDMNTRIDTLLQYFKLEDLFVSPEDIEGRLPLMNKKNNEKFQDAYDASYTFIKNAIELD